MLNYSRLLHKIVQIPMNRSSIRSNKVLPEIDGKIGENSSYYLVSYHSNCKPSSGQYIHHCIRTEQNIFLKGTVLLLNPLYCTLAFHLKTHCNLLLDDFQVSCCNDKRLVFMYLILTFM